MADPELLARLDRIALLLVALFVVELMQLFGATASGASYAILSLWALWYVLSRSESVVGLLFRERV